MNEMQIAHNERVVRLLHRMWVVDDVLQLNAFSLNDGETYLSVNRSAVESYNADISDFLSKHLQYKTNNNYKCAVLNVSDINQLNILLGAETASLSVEVEPRASHYKSHAGIFTRIDGKNIKGGSSDIFETESGQVVSADAVLQKVRMHLMRLSKLTINQLR